MKEEKRSYVLQRWYAGYNQQYFMHQWRYSICKAQNIGFMKMKENNLTKEFS